MELNERSKQVRRDIFALSKANGGYHYGGSFSCVEILIALYDHVLNHNVDRFILSKGHACWGMYVLLREMGLEPKLEGHPQLDVANGVHWTTGSEGHGLPAGIGMAMAKKIKGDDGRIYILVGDGECQEGTTWESLLMAPKQQLNNLVVIVDSNKFQACDLVDNILPMRHVLGVAANAAGWIVDVIDGHDVRKLTDTLLRADSAPKLIIADTIKGRGVSYMENQASWHSNWPDAEHEKIALAELQ